MKRRDFLKGVVGLGAALATPILAKAARAGTCAEANPFESGDIQVGEWVRVPGEVLSIDYAATPDQTALYQMLRSGEADIHGDILMPEAAAQAVKDLLENPRIVQRAHELMFEATTQPSQFNAPNVVRKIHELQLQLDSPGILGEGDQVEVKGSSHHDGTYVVVNRTGDSVTYEEIEAACLWVKEQERQERDALKALSFAAAYGYGPEQRARNERLGRSLLEERLPGYPPKRGKESLPES